MIQLQAFRKPLVQLSRRAFSVQVPVNAAYHPKRGSYKQLTAQDVEAFAGMLSSPSSSILSTLSAGPISAVPQDELETYNMDWMAKYSGKTPLVLRPRSTQEVSSIVSYCYKNNIAITPQGGNTGLVGGSVPAHDEVILSMVSLHAWTLFVEFHIDAFLQGLMDKIRSFDEVSGILKIDSGAILQSTDEFLASKGYIFPL